MDSDSASPRLADAATVVQTLLKEPVKEAVREAIEEERQQQSTTPLSVRETTDSESGRAPPLGRFLGVVLGLAVATYLVRRRQRRRASDEPEPTTRSSIEDTDIETGRPTDTEASVGPEDESDFGTQTSDEPDDNSDVSFDDR